MDVPKAMYIIISMLRVALLRYGKDWSGNSCQGEIISHLLVVWGVV